MKSTCLAVLGLFACGTVQAAAPSPVQNLLAPLPEAVENWKDMRFGMFICWGPVTLTGREIGWSRGSPTPVEEYDGLYQKWNPEKFDAREWAKVVRETGARYVVFLLKHHDGFCLWDTKQTDYNIMNGPFKRDVTRELADACREQGIGFFPYYSTCDWHHPDFPVTSPGGKVKRPVSNLDRYTDYLEAQVKELITGYGPLVGIWFDVPQCFDRARGERVIRFCRTLQRDILVNNRTGAPGDFDTPEQTVGRTQFDRPWESCITLGTQWTWKPNDKLKPYTDAIRILVACAVGDGNLALNTNPMPDGQIEPRQVEQFRKIGQWLKQCGESIYGTRGGPFVAPGGSDMKAHGDHFSLPGGPWWGGSTRKGNTAYLHILRYTEDAILLPPIGRKLVSHAVMTGGTADIAQDDEGVRVRVAPDQRDPLDTIVKLVYDGPLDDVKPLRTGPRSLAAGGKATASGIWPDPHLGPELAFDGDASTRWGGAPGTTNGWIAVDMGHPMTFHRLQIGEAYDRIRTFELQVGEDAGWRTVHSGTTVGANYSASFAPVTAQQVRLNILEATDVPTIWEIELFDCKGMPR
jgi:alpha-L-fucosidase